MVDNQKLTIILFISFWIVLGFVGWKVDKNKPLNKNQAYDLIYDTEVVQSFINMERGRYKECIKGEIMRPCETDWVTCVDEAWVVKFNMDQGCVRHDGRLSVTVLLDARTGEIKSRFPEKYYFQDKQYCMEDYECLTEDDNALNFVYGLVEGYSGEKGECKNNQCQLK